MWNKAYGLKTGGLETAKSKGDSPPPPHPPFIETSVRPQHLTQTKCEQICTRKREITSAHFNPPVSSTLPNKSLRLCTVVRCRNRVMYTEGGGKSKRISGKRFTTLLKRFHCCSSRSSSSKCFRSDSAGKVAGRRRGGGGRGGLRMALRLLLSGLNKSIKIPLKGGSHISFFSCYW